MITFIGEYQDKNYTIDIIDITDKIYGWAKGYIRELDKHASVRVINSNSIYVNAGNILPKKERKFRYANIILNRVGDDTSP